jgi:yecA family protein
MVVDAAEIHGMICGMLAGGMALTEQAWLTVIEDTTNEGGKLHPEVTNSLTELYNQTCQQLVDAQFELTLQLPDDSSPINDRGLALINWVQGFLMGFGLHQQDMTTCTDDIKEVLQDFSDIARMEEPMDDDEESEKSLFEVMEYVRISALLCFNELGSSLLEGQSDKPSVH